MLVKGLTIPFSMLLFLRFVQRVRSESEPSTIMGLAERLLRPGRRVDGAASTDKLVRQVSLPERCFRVRVKGLTIPFSMLLFLRFVQRVRSESEPSTIMGLAERLLRPGRRVDGAASTDKLVRQVSLPERCFRVRHSCLLVLIVVTLLSVSRGSAVPAGLSSANGVGGQGRHVGGGGGGGVTGRRMTGGARRRRRSERHAPRQQPTHMVARPAVRKTMAESPKPSSMATAAVMVSSPPLEMSEVTVTAGSGE